MASLTLEERFVELRKAKELRPQNSRPKIQRVANHLRNRKHLQKHYSPKLVSMYIESTKLVEQDLHKRVADKLEELKGLFAADVLLTNNIDLSWMLFVDGCALLQILEKAKFNKPDEMNVKVDQLVLVMQDVLLLENQIPYLVLKLLWRDDDNDSMLIETMKEFLHCHHWTTTNSNSKSDKRKKQDKQENHLNINEEEELHELDESPTHLLDLHRRIILSESIPKASNFYIFQSLRLNLKPKNLHNLWRMNGMARPTHE